MNLKKFQMAVGALGFVLVLLSAAWWVVLVGSLPRVNDEYLKYAISCLYSSSESCSEVWYFARSPLPAYTPVLLWIGIVLLTISTVLRFSRKDAPAGSGAQTAPSRHMVPRAGQAAADLSPLPPLSQHDGPQFFYLDTNRQTAGPVALDWLRQRRDNGLLAPNTLVAQRGDTQWTSLGSID